SAVHADRAGGQRARDVSEPLLPLRDARDLSLATIRGQPVRRQRIRSRAAGRRQSDGGGSMGGITDQEVGEGATGAKRRGTKGPRDRAFGLNVLSSMPCPELVPGSGVPDVVIADGHVPADLPGSGTPGKQVQVLPGQVLLDVKGTARFLVRDGREVFIDR